MEEILIQLVIRNNPNLIIRKEEIKAGMWKEKPDSITVEVHRNCLTEELRQNLPDGKYYAYLDLNVIACDPIRINDPYLVQLPNGKVEWVKKVTE